MKSRRQILTTACISGMTAGVLGVAWPSAASAADRINIGPPELIRSDSQLGSYTFDISMATLRQSPGLMGFYNNHGATEKYVNHLYDPTGNLTATASMNMNGYPGAAWVPNYYKLSGNTVLGFSHREVRTGAPDGEFYQGLAVSYDGGTNWKYLGDIVAANLNFVGDRGNIAGVPYIVKDGYFYVYFNEKNASDNHRRLSVARASVADVLAAVGNDTVPAFFKYADNNTWTQSGLGGLGKNVIPGGDTTEANQPYAPDLHSDAVYSRDLGKYILTVETTLQGKLLLYTSTDGVTWGEETVVDETDENNRIQAYSFFGGFENASQDNREVGAHFYVYWPRKDWGVPGGYFDDELYRRKITISKSVASEKYNSADSFKASVNANNQWRHAEWNGSSWVNMSWDSATGRYYGSQAYSLSGSNWMHPDSVNQPAKVWTAPRNGAVRVTGQLRKWDAGGDGVRGRILKNGVQVWPSSGWQSIGGSDTSGVLQDFTVAVSAGDQLYFQVDKNGTRDFDRTYWSPTVDYSSIASSGYDDDVPNNGGSHWYYQEANGASYANMTFDNTGENYRWKGSDPYALIGPTWAHPGSSVDAARMWKAPISGNVRIEGNVAKRFDSLAGDGVRVRILNNATQVWPVSGWQTIAGTDGVGFNHSVDIAVSGGDEIRFLVNKSGSTNNNDATSWDPKISYRP